MNNKYIYVKEKNRYWWNRAEYIGKDTVVSLCWCTRNGTRLLLTKQSCFDFQLCTSLSCCCHCNLSVTSFPLTGGAMQQDFNHTEITLNKMPLILKEGMLHIGVLKEGCIY